MLLLILRSKIESIKQNTWFNRKPEEIDTLFISLRWPNIVFMKIYSTNSFVIYCMLIHFWRENYHGIQYLGQKTLFFAKNKPLLHNILSDKSSCYTLKAEDVMGREVLQFKHLVLLLLEPLQRVAHPSALGHH